MSRKNTSQRDSGRKARKPHHDDSDEMSLNSNLDWFADSGFQVPQDDGYRDLFGELIPPDECVSNEEAKNKSSKKTPRKRKQPRDDYFDTPRPKRLFIPTKRFMIAMEEARKELYELMGKTNSKKVSVVSTDSLNVSGVQHIQDKKSQQVFEGVHAFVDYKMDFDRKATSICELLISMGAKVEKTFNRKVTHVMFCDGYRSTYNKAVERNIPLVSARWMQYSYEANKMLDPATYPPVGMEKYTKTPPRKINTPKRTKKLGSNKVKRDNLVKSKCDNENEEKCPTIKTPLSTVEYYKSIDVVKILSKQLCKDLNGDIILEPGEQLDESGAPMSVQIIRTYLTPDKKDDANTKDLNSEISKIEDRLSLNLQARKKFRRLLFPADKDINNI